MSRPRVRKPLVSIIVAAVVVACCGSSSVAPSQPDPTPPTGTPVGSRVLFIGNAGNEHDLDPSDPMAK